MKKDYSGQRYGTWTAIKLDSFDGPHANWLVRCDCGNERVCRPEYFSQLAKRKSCPNCRNHTEKHFISELDEKKRALVRSMTDGLFQNKLFIDGDVAYCYSTKGICFLVDADDATAVSAHVWVVKGRGYPTTTVKRKERYLHNYLLKNYETGLSVDHINQDKLDNRRCNLRLCALQQNSFNKSVQANNTSGVKGVFKNKEGWCARIGFCQASIHLGCSKDVYESAAMYDFACRILFGEYSCQNFGNIPGVPGDLTKERALDVLQRLCLALPRVRWDNEEICESARERLALACAEYGYVRPEKLVIQRSRYGDSTSGYKGVVASQKARSGWTAKLRFNGKTIGCGTFDSAMTAALAYDFALDTLGLQDAWHNRDHRDMPFALDTAQRVYVLSRLREALSTEYGFKNPKVLSDARLMVAEAIISNDKRAV